MPLQLIITDPQSLTEAERFAILTFCGVRVSERDPNKIAGGRSEPRDSVRETLSSMVAVHHEGEQVLPKRKGEVIHLHESTGDPTSRGEVRIDPLDDPSVGVVPVPPVPAVMTQAPLVVTPEPPAPDTRDYSGLFGGAPTVSSVPVPPVPPVVPVVPSAGSAIPDASVPSAGASDALPPAAPANPTNALDSAGMPWDHRIHATTKGKNQDGTWRMKRMKDTPENAKLIADVLEQNKRLMAIPAVPVAPIPAPDAPAPVASGMTFQDLMEQVVRLINANKISVEAANAACMPVGITFLHQLDKRPDLIDAAWGHIKQAAGVQ